MFSDQHHATPKYTVGQMRQCLLVLDHCLARYTDMAQEWTQSRQWELLSSMRIDECQERRQFIGKIRDAAEQIILRLEASGRNKDSKIEDRRKDKEPVLHTYLRPQISCLLSSVLERSSLLSSSS